MFDENAPPQLASVQQKGQKGQAAKSIEETYQKKTQLEHILLRPDTYIGSVEPQTQPCWVLEASTGQVVNKQVLDTSNTCYSYRTSNLFHYIDYLRPRLIQDLRRDRRQRGR